MLLVPLLLSTAIAGAAPAPGADAGTLRHAAAREYELALARKLGASASPRDRALSTELGLSDHEERPEEDCRRARILREAADAAPADRVVQWMLASGEIRCDSGWRGEDRMALARLEPDNLGAWLPSFPEQGANASRIDASLRQLAALDRFEDAFIDRWIAWAEVARSQPAPSTTYHPNAWARANAQGPEATAITWGRGRAAASHGMFPGIAMLRACNALDPLPGSSPQRLANCARIGRTMVDSAGSVVARQRGLRLQRRASVDRNAFDAQYNQIEWRLQQFVTLNETWESQPDELLRYFRDLAETRSEVRAQELALRRAGIALDPPAGWTAPRFHGD